MSALFPQGVQRNLLRYNSGHGQKTSMRQYLSLILFLALLAFASAAPAEEVVDALEFGYIELPPFGYTNKEGEAGGYLAEVSRAIFERMELPIYFRPLPAPRLYHQIATGDTAMTLGPAGLHQLANHAYESEVPAVTLTLSIYRREDTQPVSSVEELRGKRVVLMQGYSYGRLVGFFEREADNMDLMRARTHDSALNMLIYDRADYLLSYQTSVESVMERHDFRGLEGDVVGELPVHYFVSHQVPFGRKLVELWDHHLNALREADELPRLEDFLDMADCCG